MPSRHVSVRQIQNPADSQQADPFFHGFFSMFFHVFNHVFPHPDHWDFGSVPLRLQAGHDKILDFRNLDFADSIYYQVTWPIFSGHRLLSKKTLCLFWFFISFSVFLFLISVYYMPWTYSLYKSQFLSVPGAVYEWPCHPAFCRTGGCRAVSWLSWFGAILLVFHR